MSTVNKNNKNGNSLTHKGKDGLYQLKSYLKLCCLMPVAAISTEPVRLVANVGFVVQRGSQTRNIPIG